MNKVILTGRLTKDPEIRYSTGAEPMCIARITVACERIFKKPGEQSADFIDCIAFRNKAEFLEKYYKKGMKLDLVGRIQTGSYTNKDGQKVYTTDVVIEDCEFGESRNSAGNDTVPEHMKNKTSAPNNDFLNIPIEEEDEVPFG